MYLYVLKFLNEYKTTKLSKTLQKGFIDICAE